jgi:hypothetical protein
VVIARKGFLEGGDVILVPFFPVRKTYSASTRDEIVSQRLAMNAIFVHVTLNLWAVEAGRGAIPERCFSPISPRLLAGQLKVHYVP